MGLFASSAFDVKRPGVFPIEIASPVIIEGISSGRVGLVMQSEWGPSFSAVIPESGGDLLATFFPAGTARSSSGYYAIMRRKKAPWTLVRVTGSGALAASRTVAGTGGNLVSVAKFVGTAGNGISLNIAAAGGGDAAKRKLTYTITNVITGSTVEVYDNVALASTVDTSQSRLLASIVLDVGMTVFPVNGDYVFSAGTNGAAITAADYNTALNQLDLQDDVRVLVADNCGDSIRAAVNVNLKTHAETKSDRICVLQGNPSNSFSAVKTDVATYRGDRVNYEGAWVNVLDDAGIAQLSPFATYKAVTRAQLEPQFSAARWSDEVTDFYTTISSVNAVFSTQDEAIQDEATQLGISLPIKLESGRFAALHDRTTSLTVERLFTVTRMIKDFLGKSMKSGLVSYVNGPNSPDQQRSAVNTIRDFLERQVQAGRLIAFSLDHKTPNTQSSIALGKFFVNIQGQSPSVMEDIFLNLQVSPTVTVSEGA